MSSVVIGDSIRLESIEAVDAGCRVDIVSDYQTLLDLQPVWDELLAESVGAHPFLSHAWVCSWWECFGADKSLHILVARAGSKVIGIAPLMLHRARMYGVSVRRLSFLENDHTPRC